MCEVDQILISLHPQFAEGILNGVKRHEFRRRPMNVLPGSIVWIYATLPVGRLLGKAEVVTVIKGAPSTLWRKFGSNSGISKREFMDYFSGADVGYAIELKNPQQLAQTYSLADLRKLDDSFQPPQFYHRLAADHPLRMHLAG